jgi:hypothetical protein
VWYNHDSNRQLLSLLRGIRVANNLVITLIKQSLPAAYPDADAEHAQIEDKITGGVYRISFNSASRGHMVVDAFIDQEHHNLPRFVEVASS